MSVADTVKNDLTTAMKAGEKERVAALRLVLSELQKAAKEGDGDELAVLRRERKRRLESARAFRDGGRHELADGEESEAAVIEAYLPAELSDAELRADRQRGGRRDRRRRPAGDGRRDEGGDGEGRRPRRRQARLGARPGGAARLMRRTIELSNEAAVALAGTGDGVLRQLEQHVECELFLRGNVVTLDGDAEAVANAATVVRELAELAEQGHEIGDGTISAVTGALDRHTSPAEILEDVVWRHRARRVAPKTVNQKRYVDSIREQHGHLRHRPGRHRQDVPRGRDGRRRALAPRGQPHHPHAPGGRGRASGSASCPAT